LPYGVAVLAMERMPTLRLRRIAPRMSMPARRGPRQRLPGSDEFSTQPADGA
jgi:hypothetical protein